VFSGVACGKKTEFIPFNKGVVKSVKPSPKRKVSKIGAYQTPPKRQRADQSPTQVGHFQKKNYENLAAIDLINSTNVHKYGK